MTIKKQWSDPKKKVREYEVPIDRPTIDWEKDRLVLRKKKVRDGTDNSPVHMDYEITVTLDEFRQMLRAFIGD